jgi:type IV secretory pathway VirB2 component (pilin)
MMARETGYVDGRCASGAFAPRPNREDTSRTHRILKSQKGGSLRDTSLNGLRGWPRSRQRADAATRSRQQLQATTHQALIASAMAITAIAASSTPAGAAGSGMPWESPLTRILESIEGPVAKVCAVVIIIVTGLSLAFGDMSGGFRRLVQVVFGLSIAFAATSFFLSLVCRRRAHRLIRRNGCSTTPLPFPDMRCRCIGR